jgi:hypothetical protein
MEFRQAVDVAVRHRLVHHACERVAGPKFNNLGNAGGAYVYLIYSPKPQIPSLSAEVQHGTMRVGDRERRYFVYVPARLLSGAPLVIALHGSGMEGAKMRAWTGYEFDPRNRCCAFLGSLGRQPVPWMLRPRRSSSLHRNLEGRGVARNEERRILEDIPASAVPWRLSLIKINGS